MIQELRRHKILSARAVELAAPLLSVGDRYVEQSERSAVGHIVESVVAIAVGEAVVEIVAVGAELVDAGSAARLHAEVHYLDICLG